MVFFGETALIAVFLFLKSLNDRSVEEGEHKCFVNKTLYNLIRSCVIFEF